jgi:dienelactone hydrolase
LRKGPFIKVGALAHAASVTPHDFEGLSVATSMVCVESDPLFPEEVRTAGEDAMERAGVEHEVKVYPGVPHGRFSDSRQCFNLQDTDRRRFCCCWRVSGFQHQGGSSNSV